MVNLQMKPFEITENDLEAIFKGRKPKRRSKSKRFLASVFVFILVYSTAFFGVNLPGIRKNFNFWYKTEYKNEDFADNSNSSDNKTTGQTIEQVGDNHLRIGVIDVNAPVNWRVNNKPDEVKRALQSGLIHINGTALPGENGNVFITGHSSDLPWNKGEYKNIFALLNRLVIGDTIQLKYQNREYQYKVAEIKTVSPAEISVMDPTGEPVLTLMTCTPVGTSLRRLVVVANQVVPMPTAVSDKTAVPAAQQGQLPRVR